MCGIFGGIGITEAETFVALENIQRGNDGITVRSYGNVVLGARRHLVKISNKAGVAEGESDQPYESDDGNVVLVFNGELYNFKELKNGVLGEAAFTTEGDTEVWLRLYEKFGVDCYGRFDVDSMFSLAILDQNLNRLFVGRDWPGRVPLFYYYNEENRTFVFSSELKGMKTVPGIRLAQAKELPSGHLISLDLETFEMQIDRVIKANPTKGPERPLLDIGKELHAVLHRSAKNRTMGDVPICTMLSGGLDSLLTTYYVLSNIDFNSYENTFTRSHLITDLKPGYESNISEKTIHNGGDSGQNIQAGLQNQPDDHRGDLGNEQPDPETDRCRHRYANRHKHQRREPGVHNAELRRPRKRRPRSSEQIIQDTVLA